MVFIALASLVTSASAFRRALFLRPSSHQGRIRIHNLIRTPSAPLSGEFAESTLRVRQPTVGASRPRLSPARPAPALPAMSRGHSFHQKQSRSRTRFRKMTRSASGNHGPARCWQSGLEAFVDQVALTPRCPKVFFTTGTPGGYMLFRLLSRHTVLLKAWHLPQIWLCVTGPLSTRPFPSNLPSLHCLPTLQHSPQAGRPTTARESNPPRSLTIDRTSPKGALAVGIIAAQWSEGRAGDSMEVLLDLTSAVADGASGCRVGECAPRRAIVGLGFPATHCWRTAQWRIGQSEKDDGPNSDPSNSN